MYNNDKGSCDMYYYLHINCINQQPNSSYFANLTVFMFDMVIVH